MSYRFSPCSIQSPPLFLTVIGPWLGFASAPSLLILAPPANAQIIPDTTLGAESSQLTPNVLVDGAVGDRIDGGATRNTFLFHSFDQFNINDGQRVYFGSPGGIETILSRVTGTDVSDILGTLGIDGTADLFFLNPNGIVFGPNASLDVSGSFLATTADGFTLGDNAEFSATNPQSPPLLTVTAASGLQFGADPGPIRNEGFLLTIGQPVTFAGGDIEVDGGTLFTFLGQTELAAIGGPGTVLVGDDSSGEGDRLSIPDTIERGDITLSNGAQVQAVGGPNAIITAENLSILDSSRLRTGILGGFEDISNEGGDVIVDLTGTLDIQNDSGINTVLADETTGDNGDIFIDAQDIFLANESEINARAAGGGDVTINTGTLTARNAGVVRAGILEGKGDATTQGGDILINATGAIDMQENDSGISNITEDGGQGNNGDITVNAGSLLLDDAFINTGIAEQQPGRVGDVTLNVDGPVSLNASLIQSNNFLGDGDAGTVSINSDSLTLDNRSTIAADMLVEQDVYVGEGQAGVVQIKTNALMLDGGSRITADVFNRGEAELTVARNAGQVNIDAATVRVTGDSSVLAQSDRGNSGQITIEAGELTVENDGFIYTRSEAGGRGGDITLDISGNITLQNNGFVSSSGENDSDSGDITVRGDRLLLQNVAFISADAFGSGSSGNIRVSATQINLQDGGNISSNTGGGIGGDLWIEATDSIEISGFGTQTSSVPSTPSLSEISANAINSGTAGTIQIDTGRLVLQNGGVLGAFSDEGQSSDIIINASESVAILGTSEPQPQFQEIFENSVEEGFVFTSGIATFTSGATPAGNIIINTRQLTLEDGGVINAQTSGTGRAGNILINANDLIKISGAGAEVTLNGSPARFPASILVQTSGAGDAGRLTLNTDRLLLQDGGNIFATTSGSGRGGIVTINVSEAVGISGFAELSNGQQFLSSILVSTDGEGEGGTITITGRSLTLNNDSQIRADTFGNGNAGTIDIQIQDDIRLLNGGNIITAVNAGATGNAGDIVLGGRSLTLRDGSEILASVNAANDSSPGGQGRGGDITLTIADRINIDGVAEGGFSSGVITNTERGASGRGGNISVDTGTLRLANGGVLAARTVNASRGGNITVNVDDDLTIEGGAQILTTTFAQGNAGNIDVTVGDRILLNGTDPTYDERLAEFGFPIVDPSSPESGIFANAAEGSSGNAGSIRVNSRTLTLQDQAAIASSSLGTGNADDITITAANTIELSDRATITAETQTSNGGDITITTQEMQLSDRATITTATQSGIGGGISITGQGLVLGDRSTITTAASDGSSGDITMTAQKLQLSEGARILAETVSGEGGDIELHVGGVLNVTDSDISASTATGTAGNITVTADESVLLSGNGGLSVQATGDRTNLTNQGREPRGRSVQRTITDIPEAGNLTLTSPTIQILDGAIVTVSSPEGLAGEVSIEADQVQLENGALVAIAGVSTDQNNATIQLDVTDLVVLQDGSLISAEALNDANGGNITITNPDGFIISDRFTNNDIVANASLGNGGNISISTQGIYGLAVRDVQSPYSDITASSEAGIDGTIVIDTPDIEPERGIVEPPTLVDGSQLIAQTCPSSQFASEELGQFIVTGRGGLPPNPGALMESSDILTQWAATGAGTGGATGATTREAIATGSVVSAAEEDVMPVEAQGLWVMDDGAIALVATSSSVADVNASSCP